MSRPQYIFVEDLLNEKFGSLVILHEVETGTKERKVYCKCACGNYVTTRLTALRSGHTKTCGDCYTRNSAGEKLCKTCLIVLTEENQRSSSRSKGTYICKLCESIREQVAVSRRRNKYSDPKNLGDRMCIKCSTLLTESNQRKSERLSGYNICNDCNSKEDKERTLKRKKKYLEDIDSLEVSGACNSCGVFVNNKNRTKVDIIRGYRVCIDCSRAKSNERSKRNSFKAKKELIVEYGGQCYCCGEKEGGFLTIDHIEQAHHRQNKDRNSNLDLYGWLKKNNYPKDNYRLSCYNCNLTRPIYGECPHSDKNLGYELDYLKNILPLSPSNKKDTDSFIRPDRATRQRYSRRDKKRKVITGMGGECVCCGELDWRFLTVDHVLGAGEKHREEIKEDIYVWILRHDFPKDPPLQLLCYNCNMGKKTKDTCPHKKADKDG